jgi:hypothetical protein
MFVVFPVWCLVIFLLSPFLKKLFSKVDHICKSIKTKRAQKKYDKELSNAYKLVNRDLRHKKDSYDYAVWTALATAHHTGS